MKKNYTTAEMSVIFACCEDVLTTSFTVNASLDWENEDKDSFNNLFK